jgi:2-phospho-L-lactate/phosphoenolpyruvate guanylyltransferase
VTKPSAHVLIPLKSFRLAKQRLVSVIDPIERSALAEQLAAIVIRAAAPLPVSVVTNDEDVAQWALQHGASVIDDPGGGLNAAVTAGVLSLHSHGIGRVIVAHGDLPLAADLASIDRGFGITIVPDRTEDGTNVMALPTSLIGAQPDTTTSTNEKQARFEFCYGPHSFQQHCQLARACGLDLEVRYAEHLRLDIDHPEDLAEWRAEWRAQRVTQLHAATPRRRATPRNLKP